MTNTVDPITRESMILDIAKSISDHSAVLASDQANEMIYAYTNGLGVKLVDGSPRVVNLLAASHYASPSLYTYTNGNGEQAQMVKRGDAIRAYLPTLFELLLTFSK